MNLNKLQLALAGALGKTVESVVLCHHSDGPSEMFIVVDDETHYKFYGIDGLDGARGVDPGGPDAVRRYADRRGQIYAR